MCLCVYKHAYVFVCDIGHCVSGGYSILNPKHLNNSYVHIVIISNSVFQECL